MEPTQCRPNWPELYERGSDSLIVINAAITSRHSRDRGIHEILRCCVFVSKELPVQVPERLSPRILILGIELKAKG